MLEKKQKVKIKIRNKALKNLSKITNKWQINIIKTINNLEQNPNIGIKMNGKYKNHYKIKIWPHRIIYKIINKDTIYITTISHRGSTEYK